MREGRLHRVVETPGRVANPVVRFDPGGAVWYTAEDRVYQDGRPVFQVPNDAAGPSPTPQVESMAFDHEGSLWIGTYSRGLYRLKPSPFGVYSEAEGLADRNVAVVLEDRAGAIWIGTQRRGFSRLENGDVTNYATNAKLCQKDGWRQATLARGPGEPGVGPARDAWESVVRVMVKPVGTGR